MSLSVVPPGGDQFMGYIDVLTNFGCQNVMVVDGDALVRFILRDNLIDMVHGGQYLHLVYASERFLSKFSDNGMRFIVVFADIARSLYKDPSHFLAREVLLQHLLSTTDIVRVIPSWTSAEWCTMVEVVMPSFVLSNLDGGAFDRFPNDCLRRNIDVVIMDAMEWSGSRLFAYHVGADDDDDDTVSGCQIQEFVLEHSKLCSTREEVVLAAAGSLFDRYGTLSSLTVACMCLMPKLSLKARSLKVPEHSRTDPDLAKFFFDFQSEMIPHVIAASQAILAKSSTAMSSFADLFDGRLFCCMYYEMKKNNTVALPSKVMDAIPAQFKIKIFKTAPSVKLPKIQKPQTSLVPISYTVDSAVSKLKPVVKVTKPVVEDVPDAWDAEDADSDDQTSVSTTGYPFSTVEYSGTVEIGDGIPWILDSQPKKLMTSANKARYDQRIARKRQTYIESILAGLPVSRKVIIVNTETQNKTATKSKKAEEFKKNNDVRMETQEQRSAREKLQSAKSMTKLDDMLARVRTLTRLYRADSRTFVVAMEADMHAIGCLVSAAQGDDNHDGIDINRFKKTAFLCVRDLLVNHKNQLSESDLSVIKTCCNLLGMSDVADTLTVGNDGDDKPKKVTKKKTTSSPIKSKPTPAPVKRYPTILYQLTECPEELTRSSGTFDDPRVQFRPDDWQVTVLDAIDKSQSSLIIAPTSSGKTFLSYYAMERTLYGGDDGIVVYVSPTKALVNQIVAEVDARYSKNYKYTGRHLVGEFTRQILVTVPSCLYILLTMNNHEWSKRIEYVIIDEVHCIGEDNGAMLESLLLMMDCPFLALSATVGNVLELRDWMSEIEKKRGRSLAFVEYYDRYNDIHPYVYGAGGLVDFNPCTLLADKDLEFPKDLRIVPEHSVQLYYSLDPDHRDPSLDPEVYFSKCGVPIYALSMKVYGDYEALLKKHVMEYSRRFSLKPCFDKIGSASSTALETKIDSDAEFYNLLMELKNRRMLPGIVFHLDRGGCESYASKLNRKCENSEFKARQDEGYAAKKAEYTRELAGIESQLAGMRSAKKNSDGPNEDLDRRISIATEKRDSLAIMLFQMSLPDPRFTFLYLENSPVTLEDLEDSLDGDWVAEHKDIVDALRRGIGVHHSGLDRRYRELVERLFRCRQLGVVIATGTLALGINMPCQTVVILEDSVFLNPLQYRQQSGRAGRRGYDLRGNVVLVNVPSNKIKRLLVSGISAVRGNVILNPSIILKQLVQISQVISSDQMVTRYATRLDLLMNNTLNRRQRQHAELGFSYMCDLLYRMRMFDDTGRATKLSAAVSYLFYLNSGVLSLVSLLLGNVSWTDPRTTMIILCYIFHKRKVPDSLIDKFKKKRRGPSILTLPDLPSDASKILAAHNSFLLDLAVSHVSQYCIDHDISDRQLPLSRVQYDGDDDVPSWLSSSITSSVSRSNFVCLSGHGDAYRSVHELCDTIHDGIHLEPDYVPCVEIDDCPYNSYAYDFMVHGQRDALTRVNGISPSELFDVLFEWRQLLGKISNVLEVPEFKQVYAKYKNQFDEAFNYHKN